MGGMTDDTAPVVAAYELTKVYGCGSAAVRALDSVSVEFAEGRFSAIVGPSGSGKSTLLHCLAGLERPDGGRVVVGGTDLTGLSDRALTQLRRDRLGFVFQAYNLLGGLTAEENIRLPARLAGRPVDRAWLAEVVAALGVGERLGHRPGELSGGQQQRVAIARAVVHRPAVLFADEPTGNLDSVAGTDLLRFLVRMVKQWQQTVIMVTHDPAAAAYADRVVFVGDGRITAELTDPTPESVAERLRGSAVTR